MTRVSAFLPARNACTREDEALAVLAMMSGAMMLARAVDDLEFSDRVLAARRARLTKR
jgi:hypothetical protein